MSIDSNVEIHIGDITNETKVIVDGVELKGVREVICPRICAADNELIETTIKFVGVKYNQFKKTKGCNTEEHF